ncbi:MAG: hypothetical protein ACREJ6_00995 [Candidatus Methylomirabilis sp.]
MRLITGDRLMRTFCAVTTLLTFSIWSLAPVMPVGAQAIELPLGLAAGSREAQITLDGKQWTPLTSSSSPLYDGAIIRTGNGVASALLKDGTQLELQARTVMGISGSRAAPVVKIAVGRVLFRLPASSKTILVTPSVRYEVAANGLPKSPAPIKIGTPGANSSDRLGEIVVNQQGGSRIGLHQGEMLARPVNDSGLHIVKAGQSVYIPQLGAHDASFKALLVQALPGGGSTVPAGAIALYDSAGKSVGYLGADGSFVSSPGVTPNLASPIPPGTIPPDVSLPPGATPLFFADPAYAGYLLDDKIVAGAVPLGDAAPAAGGGVGGGIGATAGFVFVGATVLGATTGAYFLSHKGCKLVASGSDLVCP